MTTLLDVALRYAAKGLQVFPCRPAGKVPATPRGCLDATVDTAKISAWWTAQPSCNVGVATGEASGIMVLDVDGEDGEAALRGLEAERGPLPPTVEAITARGRHVFFKWPERDIRNSASRIAPGIDIRASGGYIIAPPSLHPSGRRYAWSVDSASTFATAPEWLLDLIAKDRRPSPKATAGAWADFIRDGATKGSRNHRMAQFVGLLLARFDPLTAEQMAFVWNDARLRPPLSHGEVEAIVDSITAAELRKRTVL